MKIYFARHGESQANILHIMSNRNLPHHLTFTGREQASRLADALDSTSITEIFTSPVPRAAETAAIVGQHLHLEPIPTDALREFDCGIYEGRSDETAWKGWRRVFDAWYLHQRYDDCIPGGESFHQLRERFVPFIDSLVGRHAGTGAEVLCISHGGVYCLMLPLVVSNINPDLITRFGFDYTSCIVVNETEGRIVCVEWNGHSISPANSDK